MWIKLMITAALVIIIAWNFVEDFDEDSVRGKRVFVTGASTGIGEQLAYQFCELGADVVITARREAVLKQVIEKCKELGHPDGKYFYLPADMRYLNSTAQLMKEAVQLLGGLDYIVLNHVLYYELSSWVGTEKDFNYLDLSLNVSFKAYVYLATYALPELEKSQGRVVVVSSTLGKVAVPYFAAYSASKFAMDGFFSSIRQELIMRGSHVSVTLAVIGAIGTENLYKAFDKFGLRAQLDALTPSPPADAARAIIVGGANRQWEVYFPYIVMRVQTLLRDWFPQTIAKLWRDICEVPP